MKKKFFIKKIAKKFCILEKVSTFAVGVSLERPAPANLPRCGSKQG